MSTLTFIRALDSGLAGGLDEVEHLSSTLLNSRVDLVVSVVELSCDVTFFPVPAFLSLSVINNKREDKIEVLHHKYVPEVLKYALTFHIFG